MLAAAAFLLLRGSDDASDATRPAATTTSTTPPPPRAGPAVPLLTRPNALTFASGNVVVLSARSGELAFVDAATGKPGARVPVGAGASAVAAGFGSLWVTKFRTRTLLRIDPRTRTRAGRAIELPSTDAPVAVVTGEGAVWVGTHGDGDVDRVIKVTPRGTIKQTIPVPGGVQDLAVGDGAVWVTNRSRAAVVRISVRDSSKRSIRVGRGPRGLAVGEGAVWVASAADDTVARIDSRTRRTRTIQLNVTPERVAVGGGSVWVTARAAATLLRIDPRRRRVRASIQTGRGPYAVGVYRGRAVWLTLVGEDSIQQVTSPGGRRLR